MGNNTTNEYKVQYLNNNYKIIKTISNNIIGNYSIIQIFEPITKMFYLKSLDPRQYNNYSCEIDLFTKRLLTKNKNINNFIFLTENKEIYDVIFEYNPSLYDIILEKKNIFNNENDIWNFINDTVNSFIFMEENKEHLKEINFHTVTLKNNKYYLLINPYMFDNYLDEVLNIYLNNNLKNSSFNRNCINKNLNQLGILILNILNKDYDKNNLNLNFNPSLEIIKNYSKKLNNFFSIILDKNNKLLLSDVKVFLNKNSDNNTIVNKLFKSIQNIPPPPKDKPKYFNKSINNSKQLFKMGSLNINKWDSTNNKRKLEKTKSFDKIPEESEENQTKKISTINNIDSRKSYNMKKTPVIQVYLTSSDEKEKLLFRFSDNIDLSKNKQLYKDISSIVDFSSELRMSNYH